MQLGHLPGISTTRMFVTGKRRLHSTSVSQSWLAQPCAVTYDSDNQETSITATSSTSFSDSDPVVCQNIWNRRVDACSVPSWLWQGAFGYDYISSCNMHDLCYGWSYATGHAVDIESRRLCDRTFFSSMCSSCDEHYPIRWNTFWNWFVVAACQTQAWVWFSVLYLVQEGNDGTISGPAMLREGQFPALTGPNSDRAERRITGVNFRTANLPISGTIMSKFSQKCLAITANGLVQKNCDAADTWQRQGRQLKHVPTGQCLDVTYVAAYYGASVGVYTCSQTPNADFNQHWIYDFDGRLRPAHAPHMCLNLFSWSWAEGATVGLWGCTSGSNTNEQWQ
jgi:hypothetical protein